MKSFPEKSCQWFPVLQTQVVRNSTSNLVPNSVSVAAISYLLPDWAGVLGVTTPLAVGAGLLHLFLDGILYKEKLSLLKIRLGDGNALVEVG